MYVQLPQSIEDTNKSAEKLISVSNSARWVKAGERLTPFVSPEVHPLFKFRKNDTVFTIGSCFARNIEQNLFNLGMRMPTLAFNFPNQDGRPRAVLNTYTPVCLYQVIKWASELYQGNNEAFYKCMPEYTEGNYMDYFLSSSVPVDYDTATERRKVLIDLYMKLFDSDIVVITLGHIEAWWDSKEKCYMNNTPNLRYASKNKNRFFLHLNTYDVVYDMLKKMFDLLVSVGNNEKKILITVSPVSLNTTFTGEDILIANNISKSTLRAAVGKIVYEYDNVDYFPSYEMVTMTEDNYVYDNDGIHVSRYFVSKIVSKLIDDFVEKDEELEISQSLFIKTNELKVLMEKDTQQKIKSLHELYDRRRNVISEEIYKHYTENSEEELNWADLAIADAYSDMMLKNGLSLRNNLIKLFFDSGNGTDEYFEKLQRDKNSKRLFELSYFMYLYAENKKDVKAKVAQLLSSAVNKESVVGIFGCGKAADIIYKFLKEFDVHISFFVDDYITGEFRGIKVIDWHEFISFSASRYVFLFIGPEQKFPYYKEKIDAGFVYF